MIVFAPWAICSFLGHICPQSCARPTRVSPLGNILSSFAETSWCEKVSDKNEPESIQCKILSVGDLRAREGSKDLLHHSQVLPGNEKFKAFSPFHNSLAFCQIGFLMFTKITGCHGFGRGWSQGRAQTWCNLRFQIEKLNSHFKI